MDLQELAPASFAVVSLLLLAGVLGYWIAHATGRRRSAVAGPREGSADRHRGGAWARLRPLDGRSGSSAGPDVSGRSVCAGEDEKRGQKRFKTCFLGTLHSSVGAGADNLCDIVDLSASGARIRPVDPIPATTRIALGLRHFGVLPARIVWRRNDELGLQFDADPLETVTVMRGLLPIGSTGH